MVWSVNDPRGQSQLMPGKICVVFQDNVSLHEGRLFLDQFHPIAVKVDKVGRAYMASVDVGDGNESTFIAAVLKSPDIVKAAEQEMSAIFM